MLWKCTITALEVHRCLCCRDGWGRIVVFTAGVGEHQWDVRKGANEDLEFMGIKLDQEKNRKNCGEEEIKSTPDSKVKVVVVPTDEELLIASDTLDLIK